jgi:mono/diheme cytochrome c family protein
MRRFSRVMEVVALVAAAVFVVLLFANEPSTEATASTGAHPGAAVYRSNCAACHGADGGGGRGPALGGGAVVTRFPDAADQIAVVTDGRGGMPSFGGDLSAEQIEAVVDYTRTELGG